jgi:hypothetical protein
MRAHVTERERERERERKREGAREKVMDACTKKRR